MTAAVRTIRCQGCDALVPASDGPTGYGAAPGCWALYGAVLAKEYSDIRFGSMHRLTVDTYAVQHPGQPERRAIKSVAVHLIGLHLALERGLAPALHRHTLQRAAEISDALVWLVPPSFLGAITVADVHRAGDDPEAHNRLVTAWARSTWQAWALHHDQIRRWAARVLATWACRRGWARGGRANR